MHLINTDQEHQQERQRGSYCTLYDAASKITKASHCMVVMWMNPGSRPLQQQHQGFPGRPSQGPISSNWLHCHGANLFDNPLDLSTHLRLTDQFKSLFRYGIAVTDLGGMCPALRRSPRSATSPVTGKQ